MDKKTLIKKAESDAIIVDKLKINKNIYSNAKKAVNIIKRKGVNDFISINLAKIEKVLTGDDFKGFNYIYKEVKQLKKDNYSDEDIKNYLGYFAREIKFYL